MRQIVLPEDQVTDLEALEMLADALGRLTGGSEVKVVQQVVVSTENVLAYHMLTDLLSGEAGKAGISIKTGVRAVVEKAKKRRGRKPKEVRLPVEKVFEGMPPAPRPAREIRSWAVHSPDGTDTGERITISEKNRRLAAGEFETGAYLYHPKAGKQRVTGLPGSGQGMQPVGGGEL